MQQGHHGHSSRSDQPLNCTMTRSPSSLDGATHLSRDIDDDRPGSAMSNSSDDMDCLDDTSLSLSPPSSPSSPMHHHHSIHSKLHHWQWFGVTWSRCISMWTIGTRLPVLNVYSNVATKFPNIPPRYEPSLVGEGYLRDYHFSHMYSHS